ncbi:hypothetical protein ACU8KH_01654 [Lachancea thermotolerans]
MHMRRIAWMLHQEQNVVHCLSSQSVFITLSRDIIDLCSTLPLYSRYHITKLEYQPTIVFNARKNDTFFTTISLLDR